MTVSATQAWQAWVNSHTDLVGEGKPLALGAFITKVASPDSGAYAYGSRLSRDNPGVVAEAGGPDMARISAIIYDGTEEAAENAATAYANTVATLTGEPQPCGDTGAWVLVHDNLSGPMTVAQPSSGGEQFAYEVAADFMFSGG